MSKALKCDVCGGLIDFVPFKEELHATPNRMEIYYKSESGNASNGRIMDICPKCHATIMRALDARRKIAVNPADDDLK